MERLTEERCFDCRFALTPLDEYHCSVCPHKPNAQKTMLRHTYRDESGAAWIAPNKAVGVSAAERFAAYEDLNRTPEELAKDLAELSEYRKAKEEGRILPEGLKCPCDAKEEVARVWQAYDHELKEGL